MQGTRVLWIALALSIGCGGAPEGAEPTEPEPKVEQPAEKPVSKAERNRAILAKAQSDGCEGMCPKLTQCAVDDAKAQLPADKVKELEEVAGRHTSECESQCKSSALSVKQVETLHTCLREHAECSAFSECLNQLQPEK